MELFNKLIGPTAAMRLLDVGAEVDPSNNNGLHFIDCYPWKHTVCAINISHEHIASAQQLYPNIHATIGDACNLPWPDKYFDVVFSNAAIEHIGAFDKQQKMASEIMRVRERGFVSTPNRWYPFEFHIRLPLITWLTSTAYLKIGRLISHNHSTGKYIRGTWRICAL